MHHIDVALLAEPFATRHPIMQPTRPLIALVVIGTLFSIHDSYAAEETATTAPVYFARTILPLLSEKCFVCHGPDAKDDDAFLRCFQLTSHFLRRTVSSKHCALPSILVITKTCFVK